LASHWPFRKLGNNEILLSSSLIRTLHVQPNAGQTITLQFNFTNILTEVSFLNTWFIFFFFYEI